MGLGHMHCVDVGFVEEGRRCSYDGWYDNLVDGSDLTLMARLEVPGEIPVERGPPETVGDGMSSQIESTMTKLIMRLVKDVDMVCTKQDLLMSSALVSSPELIAANEELLGIVNEAGTIFL